jgi:3-hydroxyacyl-CoA dehydrogenase/enoyl-CoA hydratase/3-hydroxybutyryl-CoA epimerase
LFADVEPKLKAGALLATNTSSIPLEQLAQGLKDPARLVGLHFFNPVARMQLVEIISAASTSADAASQAAQFTTAIDRLPLPVKSSPGFLINRILMPYMLEGFTLVETGTPAETVDRAMRQFGMPMGPIELADTVGLDICLAVARVLAAQLGGHVPAILSQKVEQGRLGRKTQRGFYEYRAGKKVGAGARQSAEHLDDITDRLLARLLNEAIACLREGVVQDADLLDAGMIFGTGFAPFRGGPMQFLRARGIDAMKARVRDLAPQFGAGFAIDEGWNTPALIEPAAPEG